jgi:hypothetical protein
VLNVPDGVRDPTFDIVGEGHLGQVDGPSIRLNEGRADFVRADADKTLELVGQAWVDLVQAL